VIQAPEAKALLSRPFRADPLLRSERPQVIVDGVLGPSSEALNDLMNLVERQAAGDGEVAILVAVSPSQPLLDRTLTARRYRHTSDWCLLPAS
jgi:hypothetical protein